MNLGETGDPLLKIGNAEHFAQHDSRVVEAESLVKVADQQIFLQDVLFVVCHRKYHLLFVLKIRSLEFCDGDQFEGAGATRSGKREA